MKEADMPTNMFQEVVCPSANSPRRWYALPLSFLAHAVVLAVLVVVPLVATDVLPSPRQMINFIIPAAAPMPVTVSPPAIRTAIASHFDNGAAPVEAPRGIVRESGLQPIEEQVSSSFEGFVEGLGVAQLAAEPPPVVAPTRVKPMRVSSFKAPTRVKDVAPIYPELARKNRVSGVVILEAIIGVDGKVEQARVLRSVPLLDQAALNAVQSWEYTPTLLHGVPIPIIMTVTVQFKLE
jgi:periplasmic protein TonB